MRNPVRIVGEMLANFDVSRMTWWGSSMSALRSMVQASFFQKKPAAQGSEVNYDLARSLYRNDDPNYLYGAGFVRPIIDLTVEYMGLPTVSTEDGEQDSFLNECLRDFWAPQMQEALRDMARDSKAVIRIYQQRIDNPLFTERDREHGSLQILPPEVVKIIYDPSDPMLIETATIEHEIEMDDRTLEEIESGRPPRLVIHTVTEVIDREFFRFFDKTTGTELTDWKTANRKKFVPLWEGFNEYAADLGGGQSDIEAVLPFIQAFHDVLTDTLAAHKYHSIPKLKFKLKEVGQFIANNWPDVWDPETGKPREGAKINWEGKEMLFFLPDEDAEFLEVTSVLGDSKTLLEFLIDCICIAAETPKWAILKDENSSNDNATIDAFEKRITRKRTNANQWVIMLLKMVLVLNGRTPETPKLNWPEMRLDTLAAKGQAIQQVILGLDVASQHQWVSDSTAIKILQSLFTEVNSVDREKELAKGNVVPELPAPTPDSSTAVGSGTGK